MPYIKAERREQLWNVEYDYPENPGELNYMISQLCSNYWDLIGHKYQTINDIVGALEGAKMEFYRRVAVPYEDQKIKENGDVY
jgi:hypothetical protein